MKEITVVIPVHILTNQIKDYLISCLNSIASQQVQPKSTMIVCPSNIKEDIKSFIDEKQIQLPIELLENPGKTDFASQVNFAAENVTTEFFSICEVDDQYSPIWFKNVQTYMEAYPDSHLFLSTIVDVKDNNEILALSNITPLAIGTTEKILFLDDKVFEYDMNFNTSGAVIRTSKFKQIKGFKPSIKLAFVYEFLKRAFYYDLHPMVIPKIGYKHMNMRLGSLFDSYRDPVNGLSPQEVEFWINIARTEYYWKDDKNYIYFQ